MALTLGEAGFERLAAMLDATLCAQRRATARVDELAAAASTGRSLFYRAVGTFNVLRVCNHWIADLLGAARRADRAGARHHAARLAMGFDQARRRRAAAAGSPPRTRGTSVMANLKLTLACWDYDRTRPLIDGRVKPEGIDLDIQILRPRADVPAHAGQPGIPASPSCRSPPTRRSRRAAIARSWRCRWRCRRSSATPASMCATAPASRSRRT